MFTDAELFNNNNGILKREAEYVLDKFFHWMTWDKGETILDAGCGSGNVTTEILAPRLPADFKKLVGFDISENMVKYANKGNKDPRITFVVADATEPDFTKLTETFATAGISNGFDKIFSFNLLCWTKSHEQSVKNLYSLLRHGGEALILFGSWTSMLDMWNEAAFSDKWLPYTKTAEPLRFEYQDSKEIDGDITKLFSDAGFAVRACTHYDNYFDVLSPEGHRIVEGNNPFIGYIPEELRTEYLEDVAQMCKKYQDKYEGRGLLFTEVAVVASKPQ